MIIKKISEEVEYTEKTVKHVFEVNGKEVRVYEWNKQDNIQSNYEGGNDIVPADLIKLSEVEEEALGEYMTENLELKVGEAWDPDKNV